MEPAVFQMRVPYTKANGQAAETQVPLVDIPSGTLLFRGIKLPDTSKGEDPRLFLRDFLGDPQGGHFCLSPTHNVFFYPFPHVPFGAHTVGDRFNAMMIYQTTRNLRIACMISPSKWIRGGDIKRLDGTAPIQRCNKLPYTCAKEMTPEELAAENEVKSWDNCIRPEWAVSSGVSGWMAIADYDSLDNFDVRGMLPKNTSMGKYLLELEQRMPGKGAEMLTNMYADARRHRGIPEIVLYPWKPHPGPENQYTDAANELEAADAMFELSDKLNFLPVACITTQGILEAYSGAFHPSSLPAAASESLAGPEARALIDRFTEEYMNKLMTEGVEIPDVGTAKVMFDSRTGFFVLDRFKPHDVAFMKNGVEIPYSDLLMPLATPEQKADVVEYKVVFRANFPAKFLDTHPSVAQRRAFIFERPPLIRNMYQDLQIYMPPRIVSAMRKAAAVFQSNKGLSGGGNKKNKTRRAIRGGNQETNVAVVEPISPEVDSMVQGYLSSTFRDVWYSWIQKKSLNLLETA